MNAIKSALNSLSDNRISLREFFELATETITKELGVSRASVWSFSPTGGRILCLDLFDVRNQGHAQGVVLERKDFPEYFEAIQSKAVVRASDAANHPDTKCFQKLYFEPNQIHSLLDFVVTSRSTAIGILCCEHCGEIKDWTDEDVKYLEQIAFSIGFAITVAQKEAAAKNKAAS